MQVRARERGWGYSSTFDAFIGASNVESLEIAWMLPIKAGGDYGAMAANQLILGDRVYLSCKRGQ